MGNSIIDVELVYEYFTIILYLLYGWFDMLDNVRSEMKKTSMR